MKSAVVTYFEKSLFFPYLTSDVSELSYNGKDVYVNYVSKLREKLAIDFTNEQAYEFVRHIADLTGENFNNAHPILDVSFADYRFNAVHWSVASVNNEPAITFIIRLIYPALRIKKNDPSLCGLAVHNLLRVLTARKQSIMISGVTGAGKSELQKYLISLIPKRQRIVMIEDTYETHIKELIPDLDINIWLVKNQSPRYREEIRDLIRAGLRNNPDWLTLSEVRGSETAELLRTITSGLAVITTIHAKSALDTPDRMLQLISDGGTLRQEQIKKEIHRHVRFYLHMEKAYAENGTTKRFLAQIGVSGGEKDDYKMKLIYERDEAGNEKFARLDEKTARELKIAPEWYKKELGT